MRGRVRGKHNIHGQHTRMERLLKVSPWDGGVIRDEFVELIGKALVAGQQGGEREKKRERGRGRQDNLVCLPLAAGC